MGAPKVQSLRAELGSPTHDSQISCSPSLRQMDGWKGHAILGPLEFSPG